MSVELHLPDLPEVPISLGPAPGEPPPRERTPWNARWREHLGSALPIAVMLLLALATWWLVKNAPQSSSPSAPATATHDPDYTMTDFNVERFDAGGRLVLRLQGATLRHFPDTDRIEAEDVRIRAVAADGRVALASAARMIGNGDGSEVQLVGRAQVTATETDGSTLVMESEFLDAFLIDERVRTHVPVTVRKGAMEFKASGLDYDHGRRMLALQGPMQAVLPGRR